jgi:hypothetical protein
MDHKIQQIDAATTAVKAWERQGDGSQEAYEAFELYLEKGAQRSIVKIARRVSKSSSLVGVGLDEMVSRRRVLLNDHWRAHRQN